MPNTDIDVVCLAERRKNGDEFVLLDCRDADEREISVLPNDVHIQMAQIADRYPELDPEKETIVYCRTGNRSDAVARFLRSAGFRNVRNLLGGINDWALKIDGTVRTY